MVFVAAFTLVMRTTISSSPLCDGIPCGGTGRSSAALRQPELSELSAPSYTKLRLTAMTTGSLYAPENETAKVLTPALTVPVSRASAKRSSPSVAAHSTVRTIADAQKRSAPMETRQKHSPPQLAG